MQWGLSARCPTTSQTGLQEVCSQLSQNIVSLRIFLSTTNLSTNLTAKHIIHRKKMPQERREEAAVESL